MSIKEQIGWIPKTGSDLSSYVRRVNPPLDQDRLRLDLLEGDERIGRVNKTHTCGDFSLLLFYKDHPALVASCLVLGTDLQLEQLQGVKGKVDFRVASGVDCVRLMAENILQIASGLSLTRVLMPVPWAVKGISEELDCKTTGAAMSKYYKFASIAGLALVGDQYVRDLR